MNNDFILLTDRAKPSPDKLGRLIGIAVASGLQLPSYHSDNNPIWWVGFLPEHEIIELILTTGNGTWSIDLGRIDDDDNETINNLIDTIFPLCVDEFFELYPDLASRRSAALVAGEMIHDAVFRAWALSDDNSRSWKPDISLSKLIRAAREIYPAVRSEILAD